MSNSWSLFRNCVFDVMEYLLGMWVFIIPSKNFANSYSGVFTMLTIGRTGKPVLCTLHDPYSRPIPQPESCKSETGYAINRMF